MCIVLFTTAHPDYALILIDNRDEFILRPTSRPHWWTHGATGQQVLSSRDLQRAEKGTWMGMTRSGLFAVLTNYREANAHDASHPVRDIKSRGSMVTAWLAGPAERTVKEAVNHLVRDDGVKGVGGFSMVCGKLRKREGGNIAIVSNRAVHADEVPLFGHARGETWGLSNTTFDAEVKWPKVELGTDLLRTTVEAAVGRGWAEKELLDGLFAILDTDTFPTPEPGTPFEQVTGLLRHTIFVPPLGDDAHHEAMRAAWARGLAAWENEEEQAEKKAEGGGEVAVKANGETMRERQGEQTQQQQRHRRGEEAEQHQQEQNRESAARAAATNSVGFETGLYGTQRQTIMLVDWDGHVKFVERALWDRNGNAISRGEGDVVHEFSIEGWDDGEQ
ncbi:DUF833 domain-containing protein [Moelleriella libera RCEF 2490]|uniref:DUF833 domain-containing protein n=1 Tax=Moelleriella libera RCEF 2490 TaxID=1081109 RepID=A0A168F3K5_9HYPO|nr:DUF833 domain-containing protein [Moelleriella libera RCEF 2490]